MVSKYADHCPLYRQAAIYRRAGITLDRSTLADWVGRSCWWLKPLHELLTTTILASDKLFADDTPVPVLDPGRGKTKTGRLWAYARDDGRVEMDTNSVERTFRPQKLTTKNSLFAGSDSGGVSWSIVASLIETAKLNSVEPSAYLKDVLQRMVAGHPMNRLDDLLPWNWKNLGNDQAA